MSDNKLINFESSWKKKEARDMLRDARQRVLDKEEQRALKRSERKGKEDSWMLPGLLDSEQDQSSKRDKKKKKKSKKSSKKKKKKKHKKKSSDSDSSSDSGSESEDEWVEKKQPTDVAPKEKSKSPPPPQRPEREDWLGVLSGSSVVSNKDVRGNREEQKRQQRQKAEEEAAAQQNSRELNSAIQHSAGGELKESEPASSSGGAATRVGDGGASWLRRAFKRAKEQAEREGVDIEVIAAQRWGSLEKFNQMLAKAEGRPVAPSRPAETRGEPHKRDERRETRRRSRSRERSRSRDRRRSRSRSRDRRSRSRERRRRDSRSRSRSRDRPKREFHRPGEEETSGGRYKETISRNSGSGGGWRKQQQHPSREERKVSPEPPKKRRKSRSPSTSSSRSQSPKPQPTENQTSNQPEPNPEKEVVVTVLSEKEMNVLGAKLVKAEMLGNTALAAKLKAKLEAAREAKEQMAQEGGGQAQEEEQVVVLTRTDSKGMSRPVDASATSEQVKGRRKKEKVQTHVKGERQRYFADDDKYDLKTMYEREKLSTAEDQNGMLSRLAGRARTVKNDDDFDMDDEITERAATKRSEEADKARDRDKAIREHRHLQRVLDDCKYCFGGRNFDKHLLVAVGKTCYLALPPHTPLAQGHCFIAPMCHVCCGTLLDEDVHAEMQQFRRALTNMFQSGRQPKITQPGDSESDEDEDGDTAKDCVFFETALRLKKQPHMLLQCVPLPRRVGNEAPMYFQKAIQECEQEWSHNQKLVKLSQERGLRRSIPKGLPYFHVDFGMENGFAHVVEDEAYFPANFAQEILGGMLDAEPRIYKNPKRESFDQQKKRVLQFGAKWKDFDFTKKHKARRTSSSSDSDSD